MNRFTTALALAGYMLGQAYKPFAENINPDSTAVLVISLAFTPLALRPSRRSLDRPMAGSMFIEAEVVDDILTR